VTAELLDFKKLTEHNMQHKKHTAVIQQTGTKKFSGSRKGKIDKKLIS